MYIGTIHGFCQHILGDADAVYRQYDVLDGNRLLLFLMSRFGQLEIAPLRARFNARYFETLHEVVAAWNISRDEGIALTDIGTLDPEVGACLTAAQDALEQNQFLDFASMVRLVADGAANNPRIAERLARIRHLLVDEYQDVSGAQEELVRAIHSHAETVFVVGDDDQSIYGWRGAHVPNILTCAQRYPGAHQHVLQVNYRSTRAIVDSSNAFAPRTRGDATAKTTYGSRGSHAAPVWDLFLPDSNGRGRLGCGANSCAFGYRIPRAGGTRERDHTRRLCDLDAVDQDLRAGWHPAARSVYSGPRCSEFAIHARRWRKRF
jgi:superfamily I DNA/RNA helicase